MPEGSSRRRASSASGRELALQKLLRARSTEREARQVDISLPRMTVHDASDRMPRMKAVVCVTRSPWLQKWARPI